MNLEFINPLAVSINAISIGWLAQEFWDIAVNKRFINFEWIRTIIVIYGISTIFSSINFKTYKITFTIPIVQVTITMIILFSILGIAYYQEKNREKNKNQTEAENKNKED